MKITAFHGTTRLAAEEVQAKKISPPYESQYRWLGRGIYFFEESFAHATAWAKVVVARYKQKNPSTSGLAVMPAVVRAVVDTNMRPLQRRIKGLSGMSKGIGAFKYIYW